VITNIQFDHQKWLGQSRAEIAAEKAGIVKPGVPVLTAADAPEALAVIERVARERGATLIRVGMGDWPPPGVPEPIRLPLHGAHQRVNAALAVATVKALQRAIPVSAAAIRRGLEEVEWSGRMQVVERSDGRRFVLDGAHNVAGMEALRQTLEVEFPGCRPTFILGILEDKDWVAMCQEVAGLAERVIAVPVRSERSADPAQLVEACGRARAGLRAETCPGLREAFRVTESDPLVVVAGSLYLVGEAIARLRLAPQSGRSEFGLNEWSGSGDGVSDGKRF
jgi:dihydrofolate synthase / folylpolyglutamate synthase